MTQTYRAGRVVGVVTRDKDRDGLPTRERGFLFLANLQGEEIFAHKSAFKDGLFEAVQVGDGVSFKVTETTKGLRAYEIRPVGEDDAETVEELERLEERRGNR